MIATQMLTIKQTAQRLKEMCPETTVGESTLRKWQKENRFHSVMIGRKILLSWSSVNAFLNGESDGAT